LTDDNISGVSLYPISGRFLTEVWLMRENKIATNIGMKNSTLIRLID